MERTITISLKEIAEAMVASYTWNSEEEHRQRCIAYRMILSEEDFNEVAKKCQEMVDKQNIKRQVK